MLNRLRAYFGLPPKDRSARHPVEALIDRTSPAITLVFGALLLMMQLTFEHSDPQANLLTHIIAPALVVLVVAIALVLARIGRPRWGIALIIILSYVNLLVYVVITGYGVKSYSLSLYMLSIIAAGLIIGPRAGALATAVGIATVIGLYFADGYLGFTDRSAIMAIPAVGAMAVYATAFLVAGLTNVAFGRSFAEVLRRVESQERQLRAQFEESPIGHMVHRDGRVLAANDPIWRRLGFARAADLLGRDFFDFVPANDHPRLRAQYEGAWHAKRALPQEYRWPLPGNREAILLIYVVPLDLPDGPALMSIILDVTRERRATTELAVAKTQAETASRAKSEFLANMSHEIRTPLNGIIGLAQMVLEPDMAPAEREHHLRQILESSRSLHAVLSDILDLSKIEAGKLQMERTAFDFKREVTTVGELYASAAREKGLGFSLDIAPALERRVVGDPLRLRQVIGNLLSNAVKFTAAGSVALSATPDGGDGVRIAVRDTGVGIDPALRARLFQPFEQADTSTTRRYGGTGLGLALCRQLVELMGGSITVESEAGAGSSFVLCLPLSAAGSAEVAADDQGEATPSIEVLRGRRVLLVEDNTVNEVVAVAALQRLGIEVSIARNGIEAVEIVLRGEPTVDMVLMDLQMPDMDGYEATARIRQHFAPARLPILAMTAAALVEERQRCLEAGMNDFIAKPFDPNQLARVLAKRMSARAAPSPNV